MFLESRSFSLDCLSILANFAYRSTYLMPLLTPRLFVSVVDFLTSLLTLSLCELLALCFELLAFEAVARPCYDFVGPGDSTT